jgi:hypothetical protein
VPFSLDQWFSNFLSLRHTNFVKKFGDSPKCNKRAKMKIKMSNSAYCIRLFTIWRHTKKNLTAHLCVAAHRLRNTALDTRTRKVMMRTVTTAAVLSWLTNSPTFYEKLICTYILKFISFFQKKNSFFVKKVIQAASFF